MSKDFNDFMNTQDDSMLYDTQDVQNNKIWAALSYVGILFILPLLAAASQFLMTKFTGGNQQPAQTENADQQAAVNAMNSGFMKWLFPLVSLWLCAGYNAAFAIYWMAANVIQIVQQVAVNWYFDRKDREKEAAADAGEDQSIK